MKYRVNIIEHDSIFTCVADWKLNSVRIVHAYTGLICVQYVFVKIFSVVASINFAHLIMQLSKSAAEWSGENLTNLTGGATPEL